MFPRKLCVKVLCHYEPCLLSAFGERNGGMLHVKTCSPYIVVISHVVLVALKSHLCEFRGKPALLVAMCSVHHPSHPSRDAGLDHIKHWHVDGFQNDKGCIQSLLSASLPSILPLCNPKSFLIILPDIFC